VAPKQARSAVTVDAILQAVGEVLAAQGAEAVRTRAVAVRAGVSTGTLHQYFRSREALLAAWELRDMERLANEFFAYVTEALATAPPIDEAIWTLALRGARVIYARAKTSKVLEADLGERLAFIEPVIDALTGALANAPSRAEIVPRDVPRAVRAAVLAACFLPYADAQRGPSAEDQEAFAREVADMITRHLLERTFRPSSG